MRRKSKMTARSDDLAQLLRSGKDAKHNGNHRVTISAGIKDPGILLCQGCELALRCLSGPQISAWQAHDEQRRCAQDQERTIVKFYYHGTCCLTLDLANRRLTDEGQYGRSVTTTCSIRAYLNAVFSNFSHLNLSYTRIDEIMKIFKKAKETTWVNV
jgi:hypothetical protein